MIVFPAIDLKEGACVRLRRGDMSQATIFSTDPAAQARKFVDQGATWLHVVDLDGAMRGSQVNGGAVESILGAVSVPVQLGGGIRNFDSVANWIDRGVSRVVLGTAAVKNPEFVREASAAYPEQAAVAIDARGGRVATEGWVADGGRDALSVAREFDAAPIAAIIYTDIDRDGVLTGVNVDATAALARAIETPVIASGGVASIADITALKAHEGDGICGVIAGRALYDGCITLPAALAAAA